MTTTHDVIVIGGGIIGLSVADRLALSGVSVALLEKGVCGREASWAAAGVLKPGNPNRRGPIQRLQRASLELFPDYCADLQERTGIDSEYDRGGSIELLYDDQRYRMAVSEERAGNEQWTQAEQPVWRMLNPDEARDLEPVVTDDCLGALQCSFSAQVRNPRLLQALRASCSASGVCIQEATTVTELAVDGERVDGVVTDQGKLGASQVVVCAGAWSSQIDPRLGAGVQTYPVRGQVVLLDVSGVAGIRFSHIVLRKGCYLVPRPDGLVLIGATVEHEAGFDRRCTSAGVNTLMQHALTLVPGLAKAGVVGMWSGFRPGTPDRRPYIGRVPGLEGLIAATGHYRTGLALAPITAEIVADLILTGRTDRDLSLCEPGRSST